MQLSRNFYLYEFVVSQTAMRRGIKNEPSPEVIENLRYLCIQTLQPLRDYIKQPIVITSGYRSRELNTLIGGSVNSQHITGQAADFYVPGISIADTITLIQKINVPFDQLINEYKSWVHISLVKQGNRKMVFSIG